MHCSLTCSFSFDSSLSWPCFSDWLLSKVILTGFLHFVVESRDKIADCMRNNVSKYIMDQSAILTVMALFISKVTREMLMLCVRACVCAYDGGMHTIFLKYQEHC